MRYFCSLPFFKLGISPNELKLAEGTPVYKEKDPLNKENCRSVSVLSYVSKIFEKILYEQIKSYMEPRFSDLLCGFRKNHNTQHSLLKMLEKWKLVLHRGYNIGAILMDLSKAFDTLNHELLLSMLNTYGFSENAVAYIKSYLSNRYQRTNINKRFSTWKNIYEDVPQGSVLGPVLFNISINDMLYFIENCYLCNYADHNTMHAFDRNMDVVKEKLYKDVEVLDTWFYGNYMALNPGKCNFMCLGSNLLEDEIFVYKNFKLKSTFVNEALGINIDREIKFDKHIKYVCKKASNKLNALTKMANILDPFQKKTIFKSFIKC